MSTEGIKEAVKEKYGQAALQARTDKSSCCGPSCVPDGGCDPITSNLYSTQEGSEVPAEIRKNVDLWIGCIAGALRDSDYQNKLASAGFEKIEIEPTRVYDIADARQFLAGQGIDADAIAPQFA